MRLRRITMHLIANRSRVKASLRRDALRRIEAAITASERRHGGQIRFVAEGALDGRALFTDQSARERAIDLFSALRVWDTELNNGVLIYLLLADRTVEIVADRGINRRVEPGAWQAICENMQRAFASAEFERGIIEGIAAITVLLAAHFPPQAGQPNELPDRPIQL